ncbi:N-acetylmuramoyl-L-alanine amidase [Geminocystis sp. NIES-3708]|uniref:N-acetylmuramoyl-L-alanine amidase n=1 Tax=Geminocystis sp. NIES-3708 TaxID=1615909 RepID=UPI0005FC956E|nr:N-acetylmuramoyl-L-alanine amidase [Geminocystis sp. NIES-3708]BAQ60951.1 N-acetylmuramoyl-L-alanine amidase [Geminocystis sp. NIES-3708]
MVKFYSLILSLLTFLILAAPAYAGRLLFWRFEANQNRLVFTTDQGIQPTAQLIPNPTRLVIDLPGTTLGRPSISENLGNIITNLRIGQFDARTTRVVLELAPGYTLDPQGIKIKGLSPTQWTVDLPQPQRTNFPSQSAPNNFSPDNQSRNNNNNTSVTNNTNNRNNSFNTANGLQVTSSGIIVGIDGNHKNKINVKRSRDRRQINFEIDNMTIPNNLPKSWKVNQYGISDLLLNQSSKSVALLTLNVNPDSPDWQASFSRMGGLVLWPQGGISRVIDLSAQNNDNSEPKASIVSNTQPPRTQTVANRNNLPINSGRTSIDSIEVNYNQLMIRANQSVKAQGTWTQGNSIYQIRMENTDLSPNFKTPNLPSGSPISKMRIWQPDNKTVVLLIEPALGIRIGPLNQPSERMLVLLLNRNITTSRDIRSNPSNATSIPVPQAQADPFNYTPPNNSFPSSTTNNSRPFNNSRPSNNRPPNQSRALVIIDPGHGGKDVGAVGIGSIQEKQIVLSISQQVARILEQQGIQVRMTRDSDYFISLEGRSEMANRLNADVFVSIHANSAGASKPGVSGYETYYYQNGRNLAQIIHRNIIRRVDVRDRKIKQARFYVLRKSNMPSVLLETGFVTGTEDAAKLTNSSFQRQMAEAIAAGIIEYVQVNRL